MTDHELKLEALRLALGNASISEPASAIVARAKAFLEFLNGADTPSGGQQPKDQTLVVYHGSACECGSCSAIRAQWYPEIPPEPEPPTLFADLHAHEKADTLPWRSQRGLD